MTYTLGSGDLRVVLFSSICFILIYSCPVTFCIPVHGHVNVMYTIVSVRSEARFEGTIDSIHDDAVFQSAD